MKSLRTCLHLAILLLPLPAAAADPELASCGARAAKAMQERYGEAKDLSADFVQTSRTVGPGGAAQAVASSGKVVLQIPGRMRWAYEKPEESLVVSDGETLWLYDPGFREAQKLPVAGGSYLSGAAMIFLRGGGDLEQEFEVVPLTCSEAQAELRLTPRETSTYEFLTIWVAPDTGEISRTEVSDLLGNRTLVEFHHVRLDQAPDASVFRFEPPEGVEVIELAPLD